MDTVRKIQTQAVMDEMIERYEARSSTINGDKGNLSLSLDTSPVVGAIGSLTRAAKLIAEKDATSPIEKCLKVLVSSTDKQSSILQGLSTDLKEILSRQVAALEKLADAFSSLARAVEQRKEPKVTVEAAKVIVPEPKVMVQAAAPAQVTVMPSPPRKRRIIEDKSGKPIGTDEYDM